MKEESGPCAVVILKQMHRINKAWMWVFLVCFTWVPACADDLTFVPDLTANLKLNSYFRTYFEAKEDRDGGEPSQLAVGPSIQLYLKPLVRLKKITEFDLNDQKSRFLVLETGYRHQTEPGTPSYNRLQTIATFHFPLRAGFLVSNRNRADLDWKVTGFTWRYRNKTALERTFAIHRYHIIPYIAAEPYYVDQYHKWSTTGLYAGCLFSAGPHVQFDAYFENENNTGKTTNQPKQLIGVSVAFFFSLDKQ